MAVSHTWIRQTSSFQQYVIERTLSLHELFYRSNATVLDATAKTAVCQLKKLFGIFCGRVVWRRDIDSPG